MESDASDRQNAIAQLAALQADRTALADRVARLPWWYDPAFGLLVFALLASHDLPGGIRLAVVVAVLLGFQGMAVLYRRRTGTWVRGDRTGPTRRAYLAWLVVAFGVFAAALVAEELLDLDGAMVVAGAVLGVAFVGFSRWWSRLYVAELRGDR